MLHALQPHHRQGVARGRVAVGSRDALHAQSVGDVVQHIHVREQRVILEHRVDRAPVRRQRIDPLSEQLDRARIGLLEAGDQPQAGGLARAGRAEHREEFSFGDVEVDAVHRADRAEMTGDAPEAYGRSLFSHARA